MASKTLSVTEDVYYILAREKFKGESFSKVIKRLVKSRGKLSDCAGLWKDLTENDIKEIKEQIKKLRQSSKRTLERRLGKI
jgi:predicted CopG family antitoxin